LKIYKRKKTILKILPEKNYFMMGRLMKNYSLLTKTKLN
jgi:hypothetical protein